MTSHFQHSAQLWHDFPELVPGVVLVDGITAEASVTAQVAELTARAASRLAAGPESELPEVQAWRRTFSRMGLKPTQYRCASESLLRRLRREGSLPQLHPLVDLCNAASIAYGIPVGAFDVARISGDLIVRYADGDESYLSFSGETEQPEPGEVIFADDAGRAHARRWTNRQSGYSAVSATTTAALIVVEAMHESARVDVAELTTSLAAALAAVWPVTPVTAILSASTPRFAFDSV